MLNSRMRAASLVFPMGLLVVLMAAGASCDDGTQPAAPRESSSPLVASSTHQPTARPTPQATHPPKAAPTPVEPAAREDLKDPMVRIGERVPGFGGVSLGSGRNIVYIYLQDPSVQEDAERVVGEVLGPDFLAGRKVQVLQGEYRMVHLKAWYSALGDVVWQVPGVFWTDLNEAENRIEIGMGVRRGGREEMEAAIAAANVPRGAVRIEVGCDGISEWPLDYEEPSDETFVRAIEHSLEIVDQAPYGETVRMALRLRNVSDGPVSFSLGGRPPHDFVVSTPDGEQVWHWKCGQIILQPLDSKTLEPGEQLEFAGKWEQVDNRGEPVAPGTYLVRAVLNMDPPQRLVTLPLEIEVLR